ncbi:hypothetical protein Misp01_70540 [Microtetraspora sp. NBRC 13810]|uniref:EF-hand domain-containing protein n=1 Tax=Microtetraspora sp. NBRC 13810 TaxID=3030990 RepID=UPI0024A150DA|nr:EF-hand domain-containing protein [Microtetraspora sp. NBRC 13810]GLW11926.1 hypothetical protein Misp01_70540 [Microtetraspora sp. NBRC 13810]
MADVTEYAATFKLVDADGDGLISAPELSRLMEVLGRPIPAERAVAAVGRIDRDGDGRISLEEFAIFLEEHS